VVEPIVGEAERDENSLASNEPRLLLGQSPTFCHPTPEERAAAWQAMEEIWRTTKLSSKGEHLTREQLHERR
jgi:hypothetical protein